MRLRDISHLLVILKAWPIHAMDFRQGTIMERFTVGNAADGPYDIPAAAWGRLMDNPNATGHFQFNGPNITAPYPGNSNDGLASSLPWAISLDLKADILLIQTNRPQSFNSSAYVAGGVLSLTPPNDLVNKSLEADKPYRYDRTWKICVYTPSPHIEWYSRHQKQMLEEGSCDAAFSNECRTWLESKIVESFTERFTEPLFTGDERCPYITMDGPCSYEGAPQVGGNLFALNKDNQTMYAPWNMTLSDEELKIKALRDELSDHIPYRNGSAIIQWGSHWGEKGNMTAYNQTLGLYWPTFVAFGYNETWMAKDLNYSKEKVPQAPQVQFVCAKAQQAAPGSQLPEYQSAAMSTTIISRWVFFLVGCTIALCC